MTKIKIEYQLVVFLYAYLNQIDLSLDRSRWTLQSELREYYRSQIAPERVANYFIKRFDLKAYKIQNLYFVGNISVLTKIKCLLIRLFKRETFLTEDEMYYCCQKLFLLDNYLKSGAEINQLEIEKLRLEFSKVTYGNIKYRLFIKDRNKAMRIEHFLQSENLNVIKMEEFSKMLKD